MTRNVLEELARRDVPPVPANLAREIHKRINNRLLFHHGLEFVIHGLLVALPQLLMAFTQALWFSATGTDLNPNNSQKKESDHE